MSAFLSSRGRVLSRSQVHVSEAPVTLAEKQTCVRRPASVRVETDPETGDILEIHIACGCGEITVLECHYDGAVDVRQEPGR